MASAKRTQNCFLSEEELFQSLTKSAFEFLEKAIAEFAQSAKFSTVHFAIAIELFLKARLMREHWSLLLDKPDQGDKANFFKGEAKTVTPDQTIERLKNLAGVTIPHPFREAFLKIAKHRNKMVHFVHADDREDENATAQIAAEQCAGWLSLRVLLESWSEFAGFEDDISRVGRAMERHRAFLAAKFASKAEILKEHRDGGGRVGVCPSCQFEAVRIGPSHGSISPGSCVVCWYAGSEIDLMCTNEYCSKYISFNSYEGAPGECPHCEAVIDQDFLTEALETGEGVNQDNYFDHAYVNCAQCTGYHTGIEHNDLWVCIECFDASDVMEVCGYCNEGQIGGVPEHSYLVGCESCDGAAGNMKDD
jgi:hypothetical protein